MSLSAPSSLSNSEKLSLVSTPLRRVKLLDGLFDRDRVGHDQLDILLEDKVELINALGIERVEPGPTAAMRIGQRPPAGTGT